MDRIGPHFFDALPLYLTGHEEGLYRQLNDLILRTGKSFPGPLKVRIWKELGLYVSVSALPGQTRVTVATLEGHITRENLSMLFFDENGENYVVLDRRVHPETLRKALESAPAS